MESLLITAIIVIIAAASSWMQQRAQRQELEQADQETPPAVPPPIRRTGPPAGAPRPRPESNLERELRRLLGGDSPPPIEPRPAAPPPIQMPAPAPLYRPPAQPKPAVVVVEPREEAPPALRKQPHTSIHEQAFRLRSQPTAPARPNRSWEIAKRDRSQSPVFAVTRSARAARDAFVASLVFGLPKALEHGDPWKPPGAS